MISCRDLMVGNWVIFLETPYVVSSICNEDEVGLGYFVATKVGDCAPIPVTPELLERMGFERDKELMAMRSQVMVYHYRTDNYRLDVDNTFSNFLGDREWHIHVDNADAKSIGSGCFGYLHELQNLVRVITGHDLPITKEMLG